MDRGEREIKLYSYHSLRALRRYGRYKYVEVAFGTRFVAERFLSTGTSGAGPAYDVRFLWNVVKFPGCLRILRRWWCKRALLSTKVQVAWGAVDDLAHLQRDEWLVTRRTCTGQSVAFFHRRRRIYPVCELFRSSSRARHPDGSQDVWGPSGRLRFGPQCLHEQGDYYFKKKNKTVGEWRVGGVEISLLSQTWQRLSLTKACPQSHERPHQRMLALC